jgi:uncharacterized membrane protein (DUF485 family)
MKQQISNDPGASEQRKSNIGIRMTILYAIIYSGFVILSVFMPTKMGVDALFGLNLAIAYGLALIIIAIIFAIIYNLLVRVPKPTNATHRIKKSNAESHED